MLSKIYPETIDRLENYFEQCIPFKGKYYCRLLEDLQGLFVVAVQPHIIGQDALVILTQLQKTV